MADFNQKDQKVNTQVNIGEMKGDIGQIGDQVSGDKITVYQGLTVEQVATMVAELQHKDQPKVWDGRIPYLGLKAFQESDAGFFFGREELVNDLLQRVEENNKFIVIAGPSGSGKSSVARAGLFHALREGRLEGSDKWLLATMSPKDDPIEQLAQAMIRLTKTPGTGKYLREEGLGNSLALHEQAEALLSEDSRQRLLLLVDQFEETFTQTKDEEAREAFIKLLTKAAGVANGRTIILLSLRSDFVSNCALYPDLRQQINKKNQFQLVGAMEPRDLAKAITLPSLEVGAEIDPALVKQIIDDMKGEPGTLPLMSFALRDLFLAEKSTKGQPMDLTLKEYRERGGIDETLERHADEVFATFTAEQKELAQGIFSKLVTVGEGRLDTRRTAQFADLKPAGTDGTAVAIVVGMLSAEGVRLVTTSGVAEDEELTAEEMAAKSLAAQTTVTIAHEKLIDAWPWLRRLIDENRELIALQNQINRDAREWEAGGEDAGFLYTAGRLLHVEEQLDGIQPNLDVLSQRFIAASFAERNRREAEEEANRQREEDLRSQKRASRILRWATGIVVVLLLVSIFLAVLSYRNANQADDARSTSVANAELANFESTRAIEAEANAISARGMAEAESTRAFEAQQIAVAERADAVEARATSEHNAAAAATSEAQVAELKNRIQASLLAAASGVELVNNQELALLLALAGLGLSAQTDTIAHFYDASNARTAAPSAGVKVWLGQTALVLMRRKSSPQAMTEALKCGIWRAMKLPP